MNFKISTSFSSTQGLYTQVHAGIHTTHTRPHPTAQTPVCSPAGVNFPGIVPLFTLSLRRNLTPLLYCAMAKVRTKNRGWKS